MHPKRHLLINLPETKIGEVRRVSHESVPEDAWASGHVLFRQGCQLTQHVSQYPWALPQSVYPVLIVLADIPIRSKYGRNGETEQSLLALHG